MRHLVAAHQRQVEEQREHRHEGHELRLPRGGFDHVDGAIGLGLHPHRIDDLHRAAIHPVDAVARRPIADLHHVPGAERGLRRRQGKACGVARDLRLGQPAFGDVPPLAAQHRQAQFLRGDGVAVLMWQAGLFGDHVEIPARLNKAQADPARLLRLAGAALFQGGVKLLADRQMIARQHRIDSAVPHHKGQHALAIHRVKAKAQHQRLQGGACGPAQRLLIAPDDAAQPLGVDGIDSGAQADLAHHAGQRPGRGAPGDPVSTGVIGPVRPDPLRIREPRIGPRVPGPDMGARHIQHRRAIDRRDGVMRGLAPIGEHRAQVLHRDQIVAPPGRKMRQRGFRGFGVEKLVRLVRRLVHRRAAQFGEPDGFGLRLPRGRIALPHAVDTLKMGVLPPATNVLVAPDPRLIMRAIGDRRADLRAARGV